MADHRDKSEDTSHRDSDRARNPSAEDDTAGGPGPREEADTTTQADMGLVGGTGATEDSGTEQPYGTEGSRGDQRG